MAKNCSCHGSGGKHTQTVAAVLERPRYSPGLILEDSDLASAVDYTRSLSRLLFRNLFGCGVICGLVVTVEKECGLAITVAPGLALDGCGDPVEVPRPITITIDRNELEKIESEHSVEKPAQYWVVLCGREKMCAPRSLVCEADEFDGVTQPTRIRALAEVSLTDKRPECICECSPEGGQAGHDVNQLEEEVDVDCHRDHETRIDCAPDCGCGTACACGCCVLLARVEAAGEGDYVEWQVNIRGVRRFIRPKLLPDPFDRDYTAGATTSQPTDVYWGIDDSYIVDGVKATLPGVRPGDRLNADQVVKVLNYIRRRNYTPEQWASEFTSTEAEPEPAVAGGAVETSQEGQAAPTTAEGKKKSATTAKARAAAPKTEEKKVAEEKE